jgi:hypothetical protein
VGSTLKFASTETLPCLSDLLDLKESRDLCLLFLSLLCYLEKDFIVAWLQEVFFVCLEDAVNILSHTGECYTEGGARFRPGGMCLPL